MWEPISIFEHDMSFLWFICKSEFCLRVLLPTLIAVPQGCFLQVNLQSYNWTKNPRIIVTQEMSNLAWSSIGKKSFLWNIICDLETGVLGPRPKLLGFRMSSLGTHPYTPNKETWWVKGREGKFVMCTYSHGKTALQFIFRHPWGIEVSFS
jgi:hypothetical protein